MPNNAAASAVFPTWIAPRVPQACRKVEESKEARRRRAAKSSLVNHGVARVSGYLRELYRSGEISREDYLDSRLQADLERDVRDGLESELTGDEESEDATELAEEIVNEEFE